MSIQNIPESFLQPKEQNPELYIYDFKMTEDIVKSKVNLTLNMFSFLQKGAKKVQLEDAVVEVNNKQSVLIKSGNCLMTELLDNEQIYFCKLFFFTNKNILSFLEKHNYLVAGIKKGQPIETPFFVIENDDFINSFVTSISSILNLKAEDISQLLAIKFEEIMLYLSHKYSDAFINFIQALASPENNSSFRKIVDANVYTNLSLTEIAFLANMSLSTFKRHFIKEYQVNPGKWLQQKRLNQAKKRLSNGDIKPTEIFSDYGYTNLSNFSAAFKNEFGFSPKNTATKDQNI
jgi:AraC-like DNA-binding protein